MGKPLTSRQTLVWANSIFVHFDVAASMLKISPERLTERIGSFNTVTLNSGTEPRIFINTYDIETELGWESSLTKHMTDSEMRSQLRSFRSWRAAFRNSLGRNLHKDQLEARYADCGGDGPGQPWNPPKPPSRQSRQPKARTRSGR